MALNIKIVRKAAIVKAVGLARPSRGGDNPFFWNSRYTGKPPLWIRFVWNPQTGKMIFGVPPWCYRHADIIPPSRRYPFGAWVRGFYFPGKRKVAIRPFWWPTTPDDEWNEKHATMNRRILRVLVPLLQRKLPQARIAVNIDNRWLQELTGLVEW